MERSQGVGLGNKCEEQNGIGSDGGDGTVAPIKYRRDKERQYGGGTRK